MCDYSLHNVATRPSKVGDKLLTTTFPNTVTRGFCAVGEPQVAVCLMPGTEVAFEQEAEVGTSVRVAVPAARVRQDRRQRCAVPSDQS